MICSYVNQFTVCSFSLWLPAFAITQHRCELLLYTSIHQASPQPPPSFNYVQKKTNEVQ